MFWYVFSFLEFFWGLVATVTAVFVFCLIGLAIISSWTFIFSKGKSCQLDDD